MQTQSDPALELIGLVQRLSLARSLPEIQTIVRTGARRLTGADGATFVLRDGDNCFYADEDAIAPLWKGQRFPLEPCISGWAMNNRSHVAIEDIYADDRDPPRRLPADVRQEPGDGADPPARPGRRDRQLLGRHPHRRPTMSWMLLQALADTTAVAIENVQVYEQLDAARTETLQCLARAAEYRDGATYEHTERVADLAARIAAELGWDADRVALLRLAAPLHDIGKLAVSDAVLLKAGKLTHDEFEQVKVHAEAGASILSERSSDVLRLGREVARAHHEWWDGSGYPYGLSGSAIPEAGRIVALADVYDALTSPRPYKEAWPHQRAREELTRLRGRQFDPDVVDAFLRLT